MKEAKKIEKRTEDRRVAEATRYFFESIEKRPPKARSFPFLMFFFRETVLKGRSQTDVISINEIATIHKVATTTVDNILKELRTDGWITSSKIGHDGMVYSLHTPEQMKPLYDRTAQIDRSPSAKIRRKINLKPNYLGE